VLAGDGRRAGRAALRHPFIEAGLPRPPRAPGRDVSVVYSIVEADYVTLEDGTGLVHTAPGHGVEDYQTGPAGGLPVYCPVRGDGTYDDTVPEWLRGVSVWEANDTITERLRRAGTCSTTTGSCTPTRTTGGARRR
jgi:isoleucyl-tRNA synthetase